MLELDKETARDQAAADRFLDAFAGAIMLRSSARFDPADIDRDATRAALAPVLEQVRADERAACLDVLRNFDRTGREWVRDSLWSNIFRDAIARIEARGAVEAYRPGPARTISEAWRVGESGITAAQMAAGLAALSGSNRTHPGPAEHQALGEALAKRLPVAWRYRYVYLHRKPGPWRVRQEPMFSIAPREGVAGIEAQELYLEPMP